VSLRYCFKCHSILDDIYSLHYHSDYYCPKCEIKLFYFGSEPVSLSAKQVLETYDMLHPFQPIQDYKGVYKSYGGASVDVSLLECEDILKYNPIDRDASFYMAKHHWGIGNISRSFELMIAIKKHYGFSEEECRFYIHLLLVQKKYKLVQAELNVFKDVVSPYFYFHYLGVAFLGLEKFSKSLLHFYRALFLTDNKLRKRRIKKMIRQLSTYIDQHDT